jgi:sortase A
MSDNRAIDELSLEELEVLVEQRRRIKRARQFAENTGGHRFRPVTVLSAEHERTAKESRGASGGKKLGRWRDRALLVIEIAAAVGLVAIIVESLLSLQALNEEVVQARSATPIAPGSSFSQELPGSSFPPSTALSELPGSSFPPEPAPAALGIRLQSVAAIPVPTPGPRSPTRIVIPSLTIDWPVVEGDGWEELKQGIGHRVGSANPGERGNLVLSGHNDVYGEPFRDLEILPVGKEVLVYAGANAFRYVIKAKRVVAPTDLSPLAPSRTPIVTLITCTPYRIDTMRLIVVGELIP